MLRDQCEIPLMGDDSGDWEAALDYLFCRGPYDLRVPDLRPKLILTAPRTRAVPVVIPASSKRERDSARSYRLGVNSYVQKPVDSDQFRAAIRRVGSYWLLANQPPRQLTFQGGDQNAVRSCG